MRMVAHALVMQQRALTFHKAQLAARQRIAVRAQRTQAAVKREQLSVLCAPRVSAPVEGIFEALPPGLVPVINRR